MAIQTQGVQLLQRITENMLDIGFNFEHYIAKLSPSSSSAGLS